MDLGASLLDLGIAPFLLFLITKNIIIPPTIPITPTGTHTAMAMMAPELSLVSVELDVSYTIGIVVFKDYLHV